MFINIANFMSMVSL
uniref:Uncharacterized protein n=1 Tax=Anguilla anguilla TaxID=7936 RepID=A0A0E9UKI5_ANGAN